MPVKKEVKDILADFLRQRLLSDFDNNKAQMAAKMGYNPSQLGKYIRGIENVGISTVKRVAEFFQAPDLLADCYPEIQSPSSQPSDVSVLKVAISGSVSAGSYDEIVWDRDSGRTYEIPSTWVGKRKDCYLLQVNGISMLGHGITDGALILVEPRRTDIKPGSVVVFTQRGRGSTLKIYDKANGEIYLYASRESGLRPIQVDRKVESYIEGVVKKAIIDFDKIKA